MTKLLKGCILTITLLLSSTVIIISLLFTVANTSKTTNASPQYNSKYTYNNNYIWIKYRDTPVNINNGRFEYLDTYRSSFIRGAWYDAQNRYMIIKLKSTYYHYCGLPKSVWYKFKMANSYGKFYNGYIKGNYDCRHGYVPSY